MNKLSKFSDEGTHVKDFLARCLDRRWKRRATADDLKNHAWIRNMLFGETASESPFVEAGNSGSNILFFKSASRL